MNVLVACEFSGIVREAFRKRGHNAWSCDLLPSDDNSKYHHQGDVIKFFQENSDWDLMIAHPPCTYLCNAGVRWLFNKDGSINNNREYHMLLAANFFNRLLDVDINKICVENPVMHKYAKHYISQEYSQTIQPWMFGEDASKRTCLWLQGLPNLKSTNIIKKSRYANQTPTGQNNLGPSKDRGKLRSITYQGIADAMAEQWG